MGDLTEQLLSAAGSGNVQEVLALIAKGVNPNLSDEETGDRALHRAAMEGHIELMQALLDHGADVNARNRWGHLPLHWAAENGSTDAVRLLKERGAQVNAPDGDGLLAAEWAAREGRMGVEALLRERTSERQR